jgi:hypothetical protein
VKISGLSGIQSPDVQKYLIQIARFLAITGSSWQPTI